MVIRFLATLLLVQSSSIEPKCFGSGYKPEPALITSTEQMKEINNEVWNV